MTQKTTLSTHDTALLTDSLKQKIDVIANQHNIEIVYQDASGTRDHVSGVPVINAPWSPVDVDDWLQGYVLNKGIDWYAKLFDAPVVVANSANLTMKLGATINPRAIILNAGMSGKGGHVSLGRATHIGADALLNLGPTNFTVGNFTMISANFSAHAMRHTTSHISNFAIKKGPFDFFGEIYEDAEDITIGHDVWIGERVTCLPGVHIATGSVIGAGSIVTKSTDPYGVYAGNPAKLIRYRFEDEKRDALLKSEWWNIPYNQLKDAQEHFKKDIENIPLDALKEILSC